MFKTSANHVGRVFPSGVEIVQQGGRFRGSPTWLGRCLSCHGYRTYTHAQVQSESAVVCERCSAVREQPETLAQMRQRERVDAERLQAEREALSKAEQKAIAKKVAEEQAYRRLQKQYIAVYRHHERYGSQQRFLDELPLSKWVDSSEWWRADYLKRCGIAEQY